MDKHKDVDHELGNAEGVGVGGSCLHAVQGLVESWDTQKAVDSDQRSLDAECKIQEVERKNGSQVPEEMFRAQVALPQMNQVFDQDALIQVT